MSGELKENSRAEIRSAISQGGIHLKTKESFTIDDIPFLDPYLEGGYAMERHTFYLVCDRCGQEFERFDFDEYLEAFGQDPIIDHLEGPNPNYIICPDCQEESSAYTRPDGQILKVCPACGNMTYGYADVIEVCDDEECARNNAGQDRCMYPAEELGVDVL